jgi:hypothetical protein
MTRIFDVALLGVIVATIPTSVKDPPAKKEKGSVLRACTTFDPIPASGAGGAGNRAASTVPDVITDASNDAAENTTPSTGSNSIAGPVADGC